MKEAFVANWLESRYAFLDDCPDSLFEQVVTLPVGELQDRVAGVRLWREALLAGVAPPSGKWPPAEVERPVIRALEEMGIVRFCKDQPELVDALMKDILSAFARQVEVFQSLVLSRLRALEELERQRQAKIEAERARRERHPPRRIQLDAETLRRLLEMAQTEVSQRPPNADAELVSVWGERARAWSEIADVFGDLGEMLGRGWDLARGILRQTGWLELIRLQELIRNLPQLREVVRTLGRLQSSTSGESVAEKVLMPIRRIEEERREVKTPHVPAETRGVERSGNVARMLPAEAQMLGHPQLRLLWYARCAERALLTYRVQGVDVERAWLERDDEELVESKNPRPERGPIIAVVDTSGSMHGTPELVAKALVLEAVRTAHSEARRCFLYAYSGPGQLLEHELGLSIDGIGRLLEFLMQSFGGGTDIGALRTVVERLKSEDWKRADVLLVSHGEWFAPMPIVEAVTLAKENGTRFHGVQVGNRGKTGLHDLCDPVHVFRDWAEAGGWK